MSCCNKVSATVDFDTDTRSVYLKEIDHAFKRFNEAMTNTLHAYRDLLTAFDQVGEVYGNLAGQTDDSVKQPVMEFSKGMRAMKESGPFATFNEELYTGTVDTMDPIKGEIKQAQKVYSELKSRRREYDNLRADIDKTEKSYAKKDKPLSTSKSYQKNISKRESKKAAYESVRDQFKTQIDDLQSHLQSVLLGTMNRYVQSSATFCGYIEASMQAYRTDARPGERSKLQDAKEAATAKNTLSNSRKPSSKKRKSVDYVTEMTENNGSGVFGQRSNPLSGGSQ